ncbi:putative cullin-1-like [Cocos nucifera]|uniref:Putative cullin-1-like n=1 Tax=Cocos nucifera TaxID=13894 RepID=A0A8K0I6Z3_COCNU|nr:putative cullin-1-like [Cocos nucifera]
MLVWHKHNKSHGFLVLASISKQNVSKVLPSLMDKDNEALLQELLRMWLNYQLMVRLLSFIFSYLERCYTIRVAVPPLKDVAASCFFNLVCPALYGKIRNAVISMIHQEREGQKIDVDLLQNFMGFILDAGTAVQVFYKEFEKAIFECTLTYHAQKASEWTMECTLEDYLLKVLPSLMDKDNEALLQELLRMWLNYQLMVRLLSFIFSYLERCYTIRVAVPPLKDVAASCFFNLVCPALYGKIRNAVISMIHQEREGQKIDVDLLQNFMGFILDAGTAVQVFYKEFEKAIFECTLTYHAQKASEWTMECTLEDYLLKVLPSLMDKDNEALLQELLRMWLNYQLMVRLLSFIFSYLERCYTIRVAVPPLKDVAASCFFNLVCPALYGKIRNAVISMIHQEREGQKIDVDLLQNFMGFILDAGTAVQVFYKEFEKAIFECTLTYHAQKASEWTMECTLEDYLLKVVESQSLSLYEHHLKGKQLDANLSLQTYMVCLTMADV